MMLQETYQKEAAVDVQEGPRTDPDLDTTAAGLSADAVEEIHRVWLGTYIPYHTAFLQ